MLGGPPGPPFHLWVGTGMVTESRDSHAGRAGGMGVCDFVTIVSWPFLREKKGYNIYLYKGEKVEVYPE